MTVARRVVPVALLALSCLHQPKDSAGRRIFASEFAFETTRTDDPFWCVEVSSSTGDKSSRCRENEVLCAHEIESAAGEGNTPIGECHAVDAMTCHLYCPGLGCGSLCFETAAHCEASYPLKAAPANQVSACTAVDRNYKPPAG